MHHHVPPVMQIGEGRKKGEEEREEKGKEKEGGKGEGCSNGLERQRRGR